ncbi:hypothetical protein Cpap_2186 [Ruminiclostridium papyrosolvens DSM 2782]|uniref:Uncharacterized protein n=1 Tax=Ruminiclostridium papyrosolvens DSM 2782 TaxID=588581 RepID=F1TCR6_9FIRM|nr:hypothetical protein [Ruminiclostridium papyrosolvens]EGD47783.1 hypothetical protein Cpap_2186 [Ruminiclostridium papyrosolvens DSM 2782]WES34500.1 hypothetical protein P0092_00545 [Ruminiclostridium papyrosolvens DSM 2782]
MKQVIITIIMLAIALALVIGVIIPLLRHGAKTGNLAVTKGYGALPRIENILN